MTFLISADSRSRMVIPGYSGQQFLVQENSDGSILLQPAVVLTAAQYEYDSNPELQELLAQSSNSPTVRRPRPAP
jgi:hypothetical protein